ncbi:hypothetical protein AAMO2058_001082400 [Amorphochlora amoebiformis]
MKGVLYGYFCFDYKRKGYCWYHQAGVFVKKKVTRTAWREHRARNVKGVWNLSAEQGNLGTFFNTNILLVWFAEMAENFNISIPSCSSRRWSSASPSLVTPSSCRYFQRQLHPRGSDRSL